MVEDYTYKALTRTLDYEEESMISKPNKSFQAQLDRMEALLERLVKQ